VAPYLKGTASCSPEQLMVVAASSHVGPVGGCLQRCADRWDDAFPGKPGVPSRAADVARNGVRLSLVTPLDGKPLRSSGQFPQKVPKDPNHAAIIEQAVLLMAQQKVIEPIPKEDWDLPQPPVPHSLFLREKKSRAQPHGGNMPTAIQANDSTAIRQILKAWRLIVNFKLGINKYGRAKPFQGTTARHGIQLLRRRDWMVYVDVEEAYYNVPLNKKYRNLCAFWTAHTTLHHLAPWGWRLLTLSFGLWTAPRDFVKQLKACLQLCRHWGIRLSDLVDDVLIAASSTDECLRHSMVVILTMVHFGWRVKLEKVALIPSQVREYGGKVLMTAPYVCIDTPTSKWVKQLESLRSMYHQVLRTRTATMRQLAHVYGLCSSNSDTVFGCRVWCLETGRHYGFLQGLNTPWDHPQPCPPTVTAEWANWLSPAFQAWRGMRVNLTPPTLLVAGDSSGLMIGGKGLMSTTEHKPPPPLSRLTTPQATQLPADPRFPAMSAIHPKVFNTVNIRHAHSSITELFGALFLIASAVLQANLWNAHVKYLGDNTTAKAYINRLGGRKRDHCKILRPFLDLFRLRNIHISMGYRSGQTMIRWGVDGLSRIPLRQSESEVEITVPLRRSLFPMLTPTPTLDLFAALHNRQLPVFWSRFPMVEAQRADALTQSWADLPAASWAFPPFSLARAAIQKMNETNGQTVHFFLPAWDTRGWWPDLLNWLVEWPVLVPATSQHLEHPFYESSEPKKPRWLRRGWSMLVVTLSRCASRRAAFRRQLSTLSTRSGLRARLQHMTETFPSTPRSVTSARKVSSSLLTSLLLNTSRH
jgi:hypothetical protein